MMWFYQHKELFNKIDEKALEEYEKQMQLEEEPEEAETRQFEVNKHYRSS